MSDTMRLTNDAIRAALSLPDELRAPADLAAGIHAAVAATPQRRSSWPGWRPTRSQLLVLRTATVIALLGLATVAALLLVGRSEEHTSELQSL